MVTAYLPLLVSLKVTLSAWKNQSARPVPVLTQFLRFAAVLASQLMPSPPPRLLSQRMLAGAPVTSIWMILVDRAGPLMLKVCRPMVGVFITGVPVSVFAVRTV